MRELFREQWRDFCGFVPEDPNPASAQGSIGSEPSMESTGTPLRMYPEISGLYLFKKVYSNP